MSLCQHGHDGACVAEGCEPSAARAGQAQGEARTEGAGVERSAPTLVYISDSNIWARVFDGAGQAARMRHGVKWSARSAYAVDPRGRVDIGRFVQTLLLKTQPFVPVSPTVVCVYGVGMPRTDSIWCNPNELTVRYVHRAPQTEQEAGGERTSESLLIADACFIVGQAYPVFAHGLCPGRMIFVSGDADLSPAIASALARNWIVAACCPRGSHMHKFAHAVGVVPLDLDEHIGDALITHFCLSPNALPMPSHCAFEVEGVTLDDCAQVARVLTDVTAIPWQTRIAPCMRRDGAFAVMAVCILNAPDADADADADAGADASADADADADADAGASAEASGPRSKDVVTYADALLLDRPDQGERSDNYHGAGSDLAQCADMLYSGRMGPQRFSEEVAQLVRSKYAAQRAAQLAAAPAESQGGNIEMLTYNIKGMRPWWNVGTQSASAKKGEHCRLRRCCKSRHAARQAHSRENACRHRLLMTPAPCTSYSGHPPEYAPFYAASGLSPENAHYVRDIPVGMRPVLVHEFEGNPAFSRCKHESSCSYGLSCRYKHTEQEVAYFIARATAECLGWGLINAR